MFAKQEGVPVDPVALERAHARRGRRGRAPSSATAGVDVVSDGEMGKPSYVTYITDRLDGFGGDEPAARPTPDLVDFPALQQKVFGDPGRSRRRTPACDGADHGRATPTAARTTSSTCVAALARRRTTAS